MRHDLQLWAIRHFCLDAAGALFAAMPSDELLAVVPDWFAAWRGTHRGPLPAWTISRIVAMVRAGPARVP
jgi:hypothetical protein